MINNAIRSIVNDHGAVRYSTHDPEQQPDEARRRHQHRGRCRGAWTSGGSEELRSLHLGGNLQGALKGLFVVAAAIDPDEAVIPSSPEHSDLPHPFVGPSTDETVGVLWDERGAR